MCARARKIRHLGESVEPAPKQPAAGTDAPVYLRVIVDAPIDMPLDYAFSASCAPFTPAQLVGRCCTVPLGRRSVVGVIVATASVAQIAPDRIRPVTSVLGQIEPLSAHWLAFTRFAAEYYQHAWGEVAIPALPPALRTPPGARFAATLARLRRDVDPPQMDAVAPPRLTHEQQAAAVALSRADGFRAVLLHGVTGSGKTEVYLDAVARCLAAHPQAQVLLLVPEINLTPQLQARLRSRFPGHRLATLHSGLAAGNRGAAWLAAHEGRARIVLGTRLAVFASMPQLTLIVVDEEHDPSFKAGDGVRYSARDLAVKRAQLAGVPVVLGSATPSLETWHRADQGRYERLTLSSRPTAQAGGPSEAIGRWPRVACVDLRQHRPQGGLTAPVQQALCEVVGRGEQALVFLNRRGYAPVIACDACGWLSVCRRCAVFAAFHKPDGTLRCHHCGWQARMPRACPNCGNQDLQAVGHGTQRIEESLRALLPQARIARIDRDTTRGHGAAERALQAVHAGEVDVMVGTQMIAKGHDFRRVGLVAVLNADAQLVSHDFRAPERLFATLVQVAGRAGRGGRASRVLVQTRFVGHPLFEALSRYDYAGFAAEQLAQRRAARLPPYVAQALLTAHATTMAQALAFLDAARGLPAAPALRRFDAVPMPLARLAGVHRAQLLVEADTRTALQAALPPWLREVRRLAEQMRPRPRWQVDVDPAEI